MYLIASDRINLDNITTRNYVAQGRIDVLARALILSHRLRSRALGLIIHGNSWITVEVKDSIKNEIEFIVEFTKAVKRRSSKIEIEENGEKVVNSLVKEYKPIILTEKGNDIGASNLCKFRRQLVLLGTHIDPPESIVRLFKSNRAFEIALSPISLFTSHVILYYTWALHRKCNI